MSFTRWDRSAWILELNQGFRLFPTAGAGRQLEKTIALDTASSHQQARPCTLKHFDHQPPNSPAPSNLLVP